MLAGLCPHLGRLMQDLAKERGQPEVNRRTSLGWRTPASSGCAGFAVSESMSRTRPQLRSRWTWTLFTAGPFLAGHPPSTLEAQSSDSKKKAEDATEE